jgi:hypothetical protein
LCFQISGDLSEKLGQIAHLDGDRTNAAEDNLAWLCLDHHSVYDSTTSQHKNYTIAEVKAARERLYKLIEDGGTLPHGSHESRGRTADRHSLADILKHMKGHSARFLRHPNFAGCSYSLGELDGLLTMVLERHELEHEFVDKELESLRREFINNGRVLYELIVKPEYRIQHQHNWYRIPIGWRDTQPDRFDRVAKVMEDAAAKVNTSYETLVRRAREKLEQ